MPVCDDVTDLELVEEVVCIEVWAVVERDGYFASVDTVVDASPGDKHIAQLRSRYGGSVQARRLLVLSTWLCQ